MGRLEVVCMAVGCVLVVGGVAWIFAPAGVIAAGIVVFAVGWDSGLES